MRLLLGRAMGCREAVASFGENGNIVFHQCAPRGAVTVTATLSGLGRRKVHAFHVHEYGDLRRGCDTLGGHFNPDKVDHGDGRLGTGHGGDLVNNLPRSTAAGKVSYTFSTRGISLCPGSRRCVIGRSVVIHTGVDDLGRGGTKESRTTGSAGGRLMCAVIGISSQ